jgi:hypothetical protein
MLKYSTIKLSRLIGLDGNSKKHSTDKTIASVLAHNFRDPVQVDLIFLPDEHQQKDVEQVLADDTIKLTLVEGHDRVLGVCKNLFKQDPNNPPGNIEVVLGKNGKVTDWLIPATVARSESKSKAVAYSIDHNLTTVGVLSDDVAMQIFDNSLLYNQFDDLIAEGDGLAGFDDELTDLAERLLEQRDEEQNLSDGDGDEDADYEDDWDGEEVVECKVSPGDVWQLGRHKLFCGDSCDEAAVMTFLAGVKPTFVWADPPYGIKVVNNRGDGSTAFVKDGKNDFIRASKKDWGKVGVTAVCEAGIYAPIIGDDTIETATKSSAMCLNLFPDAVHVWWGANHYATELPNGRCWWVWDKDTANSNFADCELAWTNVDKPAKLFKHTWSGMIKESEHGQKRVHPTQKPIALVVEALKIFGSDSNIIFDPFIGSGISILAAEQTGDTCFGIEMSPDYCQICIQRWEQLSGQVAVKLTL